jgi:hypothetical protein
MTEIESFPLLLTEELSELRDSDMRFILNLPFLASATRPTSEYKERRRCRKSERSFCSFKHCAICRKAPGKVCKTSTAILALINYDLFQQILPGPTGYVQET